MHVCESSTPSSPSPVPMAQLGKRWGTPSAARFASQWKEGWGRSLKTLARDPHQLESSSQIQCTPHTHCHCGGSGRGCSQGRPLMSSQQVLHALHPATHTHVHPLLSSKNPQTVTAYSATGPICLPAWPQHLGLRGRGQTLRSQPTPRSRGFSPPGGSGVRQADELAEAMFISRGLCSLESQMALADGAYL